MTPRVLYIADWLGLYLFNKPLPVTSNFTELAHHIVVVNYSDACLPQASYQVQPSGLLFENDITPQQITVYNKNGIPCFFANNGQHGFDVLAAVFYLLTRYEEYLPHEKDAYGRYAHSNSVAFKNGFLNRPLADEWMAELKQQLKVVYPQLEFIQRVFTYTPTYDVDIAWCYKNRDVIRTAGGFIRDAIQGNWQLLAKRLLVLAGKKRDPFDVFEDLNMLHEKFALHPHFFVLLAAKNKGYDKNISPTNKAYQALISKLALTYKTGIHLSWQSAVAPSIIKQEISMLESLLQVTVLSNRMHYINFQLPGTFRQLLLAGITADYSMGYGSINGFRASTCTPYRWYDLASETQTNLQIVPFCYMDANSIFEQKDSDTVALAELQHYYDLVKNVQGTLVTIFHNHLAGFDAEGRKWWNVYRAFLERNFN